jgi:uncharacterized membrane protein YhaH (DUF805 family)
MPKFVGRAHRQTRRAGRYRHNPLSDKRLETRLGCVEIPMSKVQIVYSAEILDGFDPAAVRRDFGTMFKLGEDQLDALFSGTPVIVKRDLDVAAASSYVEHLARIGARARIRTVADAGPSSVSPSTTLSTVPGALAASRSAPAAAPNTPTTPEPLGDEDDDLMALLQAAANRTPQPTAQASRGRSLFTPSTGEPTESLMPSGMPSKAPTDTGLGAPVDGDSVTCPKCGLVQPMQLLCRGCATNIAQALDAQREAAQQDRDSRIEAVREKLKRPRSSDDGGEAPGIFGLTLGGRMGRLQYATSGWIYWLVALLAGWFGVSAPGMSRMGLAMIVWMVVVLMSLRAMALRLHDVNRSGWWALLFLLPSVVTFQWLMFMAAVAWMILMLWPGTDGSNEFGEGHRSGSWIALFGAMLASLAVIFLMAPKASEYLRNWAETRQLPLNDDDRSNAPAPIRLSARAIETYEGEYARAKGAKAFVASPDGPWGWRANAATVDAAIEGAIRECTTHLRPGEAPCRVVDRDGKPLLGIQAR